jgi:hypothetical protein
VDPEELVEVEVAAAALRGAEVGAQKVQFGRRFLGRAQVRGDQHRIAGQRDADQLGKAHDVGAELVGLRLGGGQENLVAPGLDRVDQRLEGEK